MPLTAKTSKLECQEKAKLVMKYREATESYAGAVSELARQIGIVPRYEYEKLHHQAEIARFVSDDARQWLERHVAEHHC